MKKCSKLSSKIFSSFSERIRNKESWTFAAVFILITLFGSVSWLSVNSMWLELPLLVQELPEGWNLPSFLAIIVQLAGIGSLIYGLLKRLVLPQSFDTSPLICTTIFLCILCHLLLVWFWDKTVTISGKERSVALFAIFFIVSSVNCLSNILFMPYMAKFGADLLIAYFVGMGFSSLVPSLVALVQGSGSIECTFSNSTNMTDDHYIDPIFSVGAYNGVMAFWSCLAFIAFGLLNYSQLGISQRDNFKSKKSKNNSRADLQDQDQEQESSESQPSDSKPDKPKMSTKTYILLLLLTSWVCALMNGILPALQSYSALPYGQTVHHQVAVFSKLTSPAACFIPFFVKVKRLILVSSIGTAIVSVLSAYIIATAALSPDTILVETSAGAILCILSWVTVFGLMSYLRTVMAAGLRSASGNSENRLFWCGAFTQFGSFLGALIMFPLINVWHLFKSADHCVQ